MGDDHGNGICFWLGFLVGLVAMAVMGLIVNHVTIAIH